MVQITEQAIDRARRSICAAVVLHSNANVIAAQCEHSRPDQVVMAVITPTLAFSSAEIVALVDLREHIRTLPAGSWHLIFSPRNNIQTIQRRCEVMKSLASRRLAAMQRWVDKQKAS